MVNKHENVEQPQIKKQLEIKEQPEIKQQEIQHVWHNQAELEATQESENMKLMRKKFPYYGTLALCFGLLFNFCFYDFYDNFSGIVYPLFVIGLFAFAAFSLRGLNKTISRNSYFCMITALLLGFSTWITANLFVQFFNTLGIAILFTIFIMKQFYKDQSWGFKKYLLNLLLVWIGVLFSVKYPFLHGTSYFRNRNKKSAKWKPILTGILFALLFLFFIIPMLGRADMVFGNLLSGLYSYFILPSAWIEYLVLTVLGALGFYGIVFTLSRGNLDTAEKISIKWESTSAMVMTGIVSCFYLLFCSIQVFYLFGGGLFKLPGGITYAEYARQGFFQLLFVIIINAALVLICLELFQPRQGLKRILTVISACTFIMIASAIYRMLLYVNVYHLSFLRVLVLWFLAVLTVLMGGVTYYIFHQKFPVSRFTFFTALFFYLIFSFMRPDYMVAKYNVAHMGTISRQDALYLTNLSSDTAQALVEITDKQLEVVINRSDSNYLPTAREQINAYFNEISNDYNDNYRYFNIGEYISYQTALKKIGK